MCKEEVPKGEDAGNGWVKVDHKYHKTSNCKVVLYKKGDKYAVCFVGTDKKVWPKDWGANIKMAITGSSRQIKEAKKFVEDLKKTYSLTSENTVSIGHSEGGTEATHIGLDFGFKTFTFNAFGISKKYLNPNVDYSDKVINFRDPNDPVSKIKENIGTTYIVPTQAKALTPFGTLKAHGIENFGDCTQSVLLQEYKRNHRGFIDHLTDAAITGENVDTMAKEGLFDLYEPVLMKSLEKGRIYREQDIRNGSVWVSAYTRDDGTYVEGYYRSLPEHVC